MDWKLAARVPPALPPLPGVSGLPLASSPIPLPAQPAMAAAKEPTSRVYPRGDMEKTHATGHSRKYRVEGPPVPPQVIFFPWGVMDTPAERGWRLPHGVEPGAGNGSITP